MSLRDRLLASAECNVTAGVVGDRCEDCGHKLKPTAVIYHFEDERRPSGGCYVGTCCVDKWIGALVS